RKTHYLQIITFGLQRAAGPYRWAKSGPRAVRFDSNRECQLPYHRVAKLDWLNPEDFAAKAEIGMQRGGRPLVRDAPAVEHVHSVGKRQGEIEIVLDHENRDVAPERVNHAEHLLDHGR